MTDPPAYQNDTPELMAGAVATAIVHGLLIAMVFFGRSGLHDELRDPVLLPVMSTELLRWGEVMPEEGALPELPNPPPAPRPDVMPTEPPPPIEPDEAAPAPDEVQIPREEPVAQEPAERPDPPPRAEPTPRREPSAERPYRGEHNPNRPTTDGPLLGSPDGFVGGTSLSPDAQRNMLSRIQAQLQSAFRPPATLSEEELSRLRVLVAVRVTPGGQITGWDMIEGSGNRLFDAQVIAMLNRFRRGRDRLDMRSITDDALRDAIERRGFAIRFPN